MRALPLVAAGTALVLASGCADARNPLEPAAAGAARREHASALATGGGRIAATGDFVAIVDFANLTFVDRGRNCLLQVPGKLVFAGTIEGPAVGETTALVFATCDDVLASAPGTYPDVFRSELRFDGTVDGVDAASDLIYVGRSEAGGHIDAQLIFSNGIAGALDADARLAEGGTYEGEVVVR